MKHARVYLKKDGPLERRTVEVEVVTVDGVCILLEIKGEGDTRGCIRAASLSGSGCDVMCNGMNRGPFCVDRSSPTKLTGF